MAKWNETPNWTPLEQINGGQEFSNMLSPDDLNALAENIEYLYETAQSGTDTSDATAWSAAILEGETAYVDGEKLTGTMPNKGYTEGDFGAMLDADFTELELFGAYNGTVAIQPEKITATENGTYKSSAGKVITEVEVAVEGEVIPNYDDESVGFDLTYNGEADGLEIVYSSSLKSALPIATSGHLGFIAEANLTQGNIKEGVTILGITGNYTGEVIPDYTEAEDFAIDYAGTDGSLEIGYTVSEKVALPSGHYQLGTIDDDNFTASNIKSGVSIFGLEGEYEGEAPKLQEKTATANGEVTADEGYDGLSKVTVNVPSEEPTLEEITITENGEYTPSGDGFSKVTVNCEVVPDYTESEDFTIDYAGTDGSLEVSYSVSEKVALPSGHNQLGTIDDANFTASNIKSGVSIFGLTGEYEGEDSAVPTEVSTEAEMTALLESGEVGGVYKYTGTTGTYENGALYVLEEEAAPAYNIKIVAFGDGEVSRYNANGNGFVDLDIHYVSRNKANADTYGTALTNVSSLVCYVEGADWPNYIAVYDSNFTEIYYTEDTYEKEIDISSQLFEGCYVVLATNG